MRILFINEHGKEEIVDLPDTPRIGDNVAVFGSVPTPTVKTVTWLPQRINGEIRPDINLVITV